MIRVCWSPRKMYGGKISHPSTYRLFYFTQMEMEQFNWSVCVRWPCVYVRALCTVHPARVRIENSRLIMHFLFYSFTNWLCARNVYHHFILFCFRFIFFVFRSSPSTSLSSHWMRWKATTMAAATAAFVWVELCAPTVSVLVFVRSAQVSECVSYGIFANAVNRYIGTKCRRQLRYD